MPERSPYRRRLAIAIGAVSAARRITIASLWTMVAFLAPAAGQESDSSPPSLKCDTGPVVKTYGLTEWLVYSCDDQRSVVMVSGPENPANPFVFMFFAGETGYQLRGEGTGRRDMTAAAFEDLKLLSEQDITALIEQTIRR